MARLVDLRRLIAAFKGALSSIVEMKNGFLVNAKLI